MIISTSGEGSPWVVSATTQMKQSPVISLMMLIGCFQSLAAQDNKRFVEFQERGLTQTYDLSTVQMLQPGRFTIVSTQIDDADVMKLELKVLDTLRTCCKEPDGKYPAPTDLFALGPPDLPIATIDVQSYSSGLKYAFWYYPCDRLAGHLVNGRVVQKEMDLQCKDGLADEGFYFAKRASIMNGYQTKGCSIAKGASRAIFCTSTTIQKRSSRLS